ncbi:hypothetical protein EVA_08969 [gut metagenome]|uniref:Uncharacterized protein n=1 Tax=gut metagenome TaxID=749906 RepID=J9G7T2_9ZZZZ
MGILIISWIRSPGENFAGFNFHDQCPSCCGFIFFHRKTHLFFYSLLQRTIDGEFDVIAIDSFLNDFTRSW